MCSGIHYQVLLSELEMLVSSNNFDSLARMNTLIFFKVLSHFELDVPLGFKLLIEQNKQFNVYQLGL